METKKPAIIKRYQNRKLYHTDLHCYVTLEDITTLLKKGTPIQVIDNKSKRDITGETLLTLNYYKMRKELDLSSAAVQEQLIQEIIASPEESLYNPT